MDEIRTSEELNPGLLLPAPIDNISTHSEPTGTASSSPVYLQSASLDEHSYCAPLLSNAHTGSISDLFTISEPPSESEATRQSLQDFQWDCSGGLSGGEFVVQYGEDVNFDGFNFEIPSEAKGVSGGGVDTFQWNERMTDGDPDQINTVEVTSTEVGASCRGKKKDTEKKPKLTKPSKLRKYSRPRRRDYIRNRSERQKYFEAAFERLSSQLKRLCCQTKSEGGLSAVFEGKVYHAVLGAFPNPGSAAEELQTYDNTESESTSSLTTPAEVDDHCYAATMLTQNVLSSAVRDHQYNEKTQPPGLEWDVDDDDNDFEMDEVKKKAENLDFIEKMGARDQVVCRRTASIFFQKIKLEERTRATVKIEIKYEACVIDDKNFQYCADVIVSSRKPLPRILKKLTPTFVPNKPQQREAVIPIPSTLDNSDAAQLTIFLANNIDDSPTVVHIPEIPTETATSGYAVQLTASPNGFPIFQVASSDAEIQSNINDAQANVPVIVQSTEQYRTLSDRDSEADLSFDYQGSPMDHVTTSQCSVQDSSTNTQPICAICMKSKANSARNISTKTEEEFWVRCNDPFCYYLVHTSCVGFMVTHATHLKQLPAFYCKLHR